MGKRKSSPPPQSPPTFDWVVWTLWAATFIALAAVPDQKILRYKLLAVETGVAALLAAAFLRWTISDNARWVRTPLDLPVALYGAGGLLFYLLSPERGVSSLELTRILFSTATFFAATQTIGPLRRPDRVLAVWPVTAALVGLCALLQLRGGLGRLIVPRLDRPMVTFGNPIFLAAYFAASFAAAAGLLWSARARPPSRSAALYAAAAGVIALGLWSTQTRSALAGLGAAALLAALAALKGRRRCIAITAVAAAGLLALWWFRDRQWTHGLIWRDTLALWHRYPWFGCGLGRFHIEFPEYASPAIKALWPQQKVIVNFAHNEYLQVLAETGVVGFGFLAYVLTSACAWLLRTWAQPPLSAEKRRSLGMGLAAAALIGQNMFSPDLRFGLSSFILFFALGAALARTAGTQVPLPAFPGRYGAAALGAVFLIVWGQRAVGPLLAQRRLSRQPSFHIRANEAVTEALRRGEALLAKDPGNVDIAENLAYLYAKERDWPHAVSRFKLAARLDPGRPGPLNNLGNIHYLLRDREQAIAYWKKSLAVKADQIDAHTNLGKALYEVGRLKESAKHLQEVLRLDPNNEKAQIILKKMIE